jgi:hypothetical protein
VSITSRVATTLFVDLLDDAAMFPPGNASASDALRAHQAWRRGPDADLVGPLLVSADRMPEFTAALAADPVGLRIVLIGAAEPPPETAAHGLSLVAFEVVSADGRVPSSPGRLAVEPASLDLVEDLLENLGEARIGGRPVVGKLRTGGVSADAFPSETELAFCILAAFNAGVPFKLTAGLHHAVRHTAADTGFEHHGFLNVLVAAARCLCGAGEDELSATLAERNADPLVDEIARLSPDDAIAVRSVFLSFGCCGVDEPIADLRSLGLIADAG